MRTYHVWTDIEDSFMRDNVNKITVWSEMTELMEKEFQIKRTIQSIKGRSEIRALK